jgi:hypothetical protein
VNYAESVKVVRKAANKLKREVLRIPPINYVWDMQYYAALGRHGSALPWIGQREASMVNALRKDGVLVTSLDAFDLPGTKAFLDSTMSLVEELRAMPTNGGNAIRLPLDRLIAHPAIYMWGLQERLLDLVENHIGLPLMYHGADLRREIPDGRATDVRQWHIDAEDMRMVKVITYMNDVTPTGGPFQYMSRELSAATAKTLRYSSGFVTDRAMSAVVPESQWQAATGPFATAALADTCGVFHRAKPPIENERYSVTFSFSSRRPVKIYDTKVFTPQQMAPILEQLNPRQRATLPPRSYKND